MHFMVNAVRSNIQNELVAEIYRENEFSEMLQVDSCMRCLRHPRRRHCDAVPSVVCVLLWRRIAR